jgi:EmrB/QacA subfamily drug resistance transporter
MSMPVQSTARSRWLAFAVLCSMQLMIVIDISIVTVALRSIQRDLGFPQARLAWVTNAYTIGFGGLLLLSGRLGDLIGRKRMFITGLAVFTVASALCGASQNQEMLVAMRFLQGAGAAMAYAVVMGIVFTVFTEPGGLGKAMGALGFVQAAGASVGIIAGGVVTQGINWHWVFYVNVPIGIAAAILAMRLVPADRGIGLSAGVDVVGAVLVTAGLMLGVYTIATVVDYGWGSGHTLGFGLGSIVLLGAFVIRQATAARPLIRLSIFQSRNLSGANLIHLLLVAGAISFNILVALYMQQVAGYSPSRTSFAFLPLALIAAAVSLGLSARLTMRFGPRNVLVGGLVLVVAGLALATRLPTSPDYVVDILSIALLMGVGGGLAMPAVMMLAMSIRSPADAGLASGLAGTSGMVGDSLGIATLIGVAAARTKSLLGQGEEIKSALNGGFHLAFGVAAIIVAVAVVVGIFVLRSQPVQPPAEAAEADGMVAADPSSPEGARS